MGYESKFYFTIVHHDYPHPWQVNPQVDTDEGWVQGYYGEKVAMVDCSKMGHESTVAKLIVNCIRAEKRRIGIGGMGYWLYVDGESGSCTDKYDDPITPIDLFDLWNALNMDYPPENDGENYRRAMTLRDVTQHFVGNVRSYETGPGKLVVLHYGY